MTSGGSSLFIYFNCKGWGQVGGSGADQDEGQAEGVVPASPRRARLNTRALFPEFGGRRGEFPRRGGRARSWLYSLVSRHSRAYQGNSYYLRDLWPEPLKVVLSIALLRFGGGSLEPVHELHHIFAACHLVARHQHDLVPR